MEQFYKYIHKCKICGRKFTTMKSVNVNCAECTEKLYGAKRLRERSSMHGEVVRCEA